MKRTVDNWRELLAALTPEQAAKRIMGDLTHYREGGNYEREDREQLANALRAWVDVSAGK